MSETESEGEMDFSTLAGEIEGVLGDLDSRIEAAKKAYTEAMSSASEPTRVVGLKDELDQLFQEAQETTLSFFERLDANEEEEGSDTLRRTIEQKSIKWSRDKRPLDRAYTQFRHDRVEVESGHLASTSKRPSSRRSGRSSARSGSSTDPRVELELQKIEAERIAQEVRIQQQAVEEEAARQHQTVTAEAKRQADLEFLRAQSEVRKAEVRAARWSSRGSMNHSVLSTSTKATPLRRQDTRNVSTTLVSGAPTRPRSTGGIASAPPDGPAEDVTRPSSAPVLASGIQQNKTMQDPSSATTRPETTPATAPIHDGKPPVAEPSCETGAVPNPTSVYTSVPARPCTTIATVPQSPSDARTMLTSNQLGSVAGVTYTHGPANPPLFSAPTRRSMPPYQPGYGFPSYGQQMVHLPPPPPARPADSGIPTDPIVDSAYRQVGGQEALCNIMGTVKRGFDIQMMKIRKFKGKPIDYTRFMTEFDNYFEPPAAPGAGTMQHPSSVKVSNLIDCEGDARRAIEHCRSIKPDDEAYCSARRILFENYRRPIFIAAAHVEDLTKGPLIDPTDLNSLTSASDNLQSAVRGLQRCNALIQLDAPHSLQSIMGRYPADFLDKCVEYYECTLTKGEELTFLQFAKFVRCKASLARTPCARFVHDLRQKTSRPPRRVAVKNFSTAVHPAQTALGSPATSINATDTQATTQAVCLFCDGDHPLFKCEQFKVKTKKRLWVLEKRLCFNCLRPGHRSRQCQSPQRCRVSGCRKAHHTMLHDEFVAEITGNADDNKPKTTAEVHSSTTIDKGLPIRLKVVPVKVYDVISGTPIITHAFLDSGATRSLCSLGLLEKLGVKGTPETCEITTATGTSVRNGQRVALCVQGVSEEHPVLIDNFFATDPLPCVETSIPTVQAVKQFSHLRDISLPTVPCNDVDVLIGLDVLSRFPIKDQRSGTHDMPSAELTVFGWALQGADKTMPNGNANGVDFSDARPTTIGPPVASDNLIKHCSQPLGPLCSSCQSDFADLKTDPYKTHNSLDDERSLSMMKRTVCRLNGRFQVGMLWRRAGIKFSNNRAVALRALQGQQRRFAQNPDLFRKYCGKMRELRENGYSRVIPEPLLSPTDRTLYLIHFNTPQDKFRIVFDASRKWRGQCLNDQLLTGPDQNCGLVPVLCRFREGEFAFSADIAQMFHRILALPEDVDSLRFLWLENDSRDGPVVDHQMLVHLFGARSSPAVAQFCLRQVGYTNETNADDKTVECVMKNFYVDDCLYSCETAEEAVSVIRQLRPLLEDSGFHLTKFASNSVEVLATVPESDRASNVMDLDLEGSDTERALGVIWNVASDCIEVRTRIKPRALTRRGVSSMIAQVYDPLGVVAPFILPARLLSQELNRLDYGWDDPIEGAHKSTWAKWVDALPELGNLSFSRCYKPAGFVPVNIQLHSFADASSTGYSACCYLRFVDADGKTHVSFVRSLARVVPKDCPTIPRLELTAAVAAVKLGRDVLADLSYRIDDVYYWTDSSSVIQCIHATSVRFHTFVHQRLMKIRALTRPEMWRHVDSARNPADIGSRGLMPNKWKKADLWFYGPEFLQLDCDSWPTSPLAKLEVDNPEMKREVVSFVDSNQLPSDARAIADFALHYSTLNKLKRAVAWMLRFRTLLLWKSRGSLSEPGVVPWTGPLSVVELDRAMVELAKVAQRDAYPSVMRVLERSDDPGSAPGGGAKVGVVNKALAKLDPFVKDGALVVGGRLRRAPLPDQQKFPLILPPGHHITRLVVEHYHRMNGHCGTLHVLSQVRERFWIMKGQATVRKILSKCIYCQRRSATAGEQLMADLPEFRATPGKTVFHNTMVDYLGPLKVKRHRTELKRYGCLFTCLNTRAVHLEVVDSLETPAFLMAFHKFADLRSKPAHLYSDNASTFVGAQKELKKAVRNLDVDAVSSSLSSRDIQWHFSPPLAPHHNGAVERIIKDVKRILYALSDKMPFQDNSLSAIFAGVARILNDRPLTSISDDPRDLKCLTPNAILTGNLDPSLPTKYVL